MSYKNATKLPVSCLKYNSHGNLFRICMWILSLLNYEPYVLLCPTCFRASSASCPTCSRTLRPLMPHIPCALRAHVFHVPRARCGLVPCALWALFPFVPYRFVLYVLCFLISPFSLLSFHASRSYFSVHLLII